MATVKFYLRDHKRNGKLRDDEVTIFACFSLTRDQRFFVKTDERIVPKYWNFRTQDAKPQHHHSIEINSYLEDFRNELINTWRQWRKDHKTYEEFRKFIHSRNKNERPPKGTKLIESEDELGVVELTEEEKKSIFPVCELFIQQYKKEMADATPEKYQATFRYVQKFNPFITFEELDNNFYDAFKRFLYDQPVTYKLSKNGKLRIDKYGHPKLKFPNPNFAYYKLINQGDYYLAIKDKNFDINKDKPVPLLDETVYRHLKNIQTFLTWAKGRGYPVNPIYTSWKIITRIYEDIITLEEDEIKHLLYFKFKDETTQLGINYLLLECFCGQRISDTRRFDKKDLDYDTWSFRRHKGRRLNQHKAVIQFRGFMKPALNILASYNFCMPKLSFTKINYHIKKGCKEAGINSPFSQERWCENKLIRIEGPKYEFLSSHAGRKSFITLALSHGVPHKVVMDLTGIKSFKTIDFYNKRVATSVANKYMEQLEKAVPMGISITGT